MAYDPNFPVDHQQLVGADFRVQFQGLAAQNAALQAQVNQLIAQGTALAAQVAALQAQVAALPTLSTSANNVNGVATLAGTPSNPPTQQEAMAIMAKLNEVITGLHRS